MSGNADAASIVALLAAVGVVIKRAGPAALARSWLRARNRRSVARLHERAITEAYASARMSYLSEVAPVAEFTQRIGRASGDATFSAIEPAFRLFAADNSEDARSYGARVVAVDVLYVDLFQLIWYETHLPVSPADFESFAATARDRLVGLIGHILARFGSDLAEDVAQATLVAVWQRWKRLGAPDDPSAYATRVAIRLAVRYVQAAGQIRTTKVTEDLSDNRSDQELEAIPLRVDLDRAMEKLPNRQRAIMRLHLAGKSNQEIADLLKISPGTVGAQLHIARNKLRVLLSNRTGG